jgi:hypothetical protein
LRAHGLKNQSASYEYIFSISKCTKWREIRRWDRKWKLETSILTNGKGFGFTRDP